MLRMAEGRQSQATPGSAATVPQAAVAGGNRDAIRSSECISPRQYVTELDSSEDRAEGGAERRAAAADRSSAEEAAEDMAADRAISGLSSVAALSQPQSTSSAKALAALDRSRHERNYLFLRSVDTIQAKRRYEDICHFILHTRILQKRLRIPIYVELNRTLKTLSIAFSHQVAQGGLSAPSRVGGPGHRPVRGGQCGAVR